MNQLLADSGRTWHFTCLYTMEKSGSTSRSLSVFLALLLVVLVANLAFCVVLLSRQIDLNQKLEKQRERVDRNTNILRLTHLV